MSIIPIIPLGSKPPPAHSRTSPLRWLLKLFRRSARRREALEELEFHVEMLVAEKIRGGASEEEARRQARLELGDVEVAAEKLADERARCRAGDARPRPVDRRP